MTREGRGEKAEYNSLEKLVQKLEGEIRNHIRTEHQLRLYIESLETEEHIKNAQVENLNEKMNKVKRENDELKELLELHKRELSMAKSRRFKKHPDKQGKGSLPQVKKALTNSQGSIVASAQPERIRQVPQEEQNRGRRQRFVRQHAGVERRLGVVVGVIVEDRERLRGVKHAAQRAGIPRVVLTSSTVAVSVSGLALACGTTTSR